MNGRGRNGAAEFLHKNGMVVRGQDNEQGGMPIVVPRPSISFVEKLHTLLVLLRKKM